MSRTSIALNAGSRRAGHGVAGHLPHDVAADVEHPDREPLARSGGEQTDRRAARPGPALDEIARREAVHHADGGRMREPERVA